MMFMWTHKPPPEAVTVAQERERAFGALAERARALNESVTEYVERDTLPAEHRVVLERAQAFNDARSAFIEAAAALRDAEDSSQRLMARALDAHTRAEAVYKDARLALRRASETPL